MNRGQICSTNLCVNQGRDDFAPFLLPAVLGSNFVDLLRIPQEVHRNPATVFDDEFFISEQSTNLFTKVILGDLLP